jgi:endogenous inhibitor of DNA gyrase (YacG/DUF329 family)
MNEINDIINCPNCGKEVEQTDGKREKRFCDVTCRSNFWQKEQRKSKKQPLFKTGVAVQNLNQNTCQQQPITSEPPKSNYAINTTKEVSPNQNFDKATAERRVKEIEAELKSPPKSPQIGIRAWTMIRQTELNNLKKQL